MPHALEAEQNVLGIFLKHGIKTEQSITAIEMLNENCFYQNVNAELFKAINSTYQKGFTPEAVYISNTFGFNKSYIAEIVKSIGAEANIIHYVNILLEKEKERRMIDIFKLCANTVLEPMTHDEKHERISHYLKGIEQNSGVTSVIEMNEAVNQMIDEVEYLHSNDVDYGIPTGYTDLDKYIGGFNKGELITLGARTSVGKSALGMNIVENMAKKGKRILYVTMEMSAKSLAGRVICSQGRANNFILKNPKNARQEDWGSFTNGAIIASKLPIFIADMPRPTAKEIRAVARNFMRKGGFDCLVVDHLHLMRHGDKFGAVEGIADTTAELKGLAVELDIPILLMAQLNRNNANEGRYPIITDLKGSGSIEQDSDIVMLIHRNDQDEELNGKAVVMLVKNRTGEKDVGITLKNNLQHYRFDNFISEQEFY